MKILIKIVESIAYVAGALSAIIAGIGMIITVIALTIRLNTFIARKSYFNDIKRLFEISQDVFDVYEKNLKYGHWLHCIRVSKYMYKRTTNRFLKEFFSRQ